MAKEKEKKTDAKVSDDKASKASDQVKVKLPSIEEMLEAGVQFGHETKRWNPKMRDFIFTSKEKIHIIDVTQTLENLQKAVEFLVNIASKGEVLFVGTKKQAQAIVRREAVRAGAHFVDRRWAGGLLTNFEVIQKSINKLNELERQFEEGVKDRTKFEISQMKKEWSRLDKLYSGVKQMKSKPVAAVIVDIKYDRGALKECRQLGIPVVALVDTNVDPELVNYPVPSNDDALKVLEMMIKVFADAVLEGNKGKGVQHHLENYLEKQIAVLHSEDESDSESTVVANEEDSSPKKVTVKKQVKSVRKKAEKVQAKGILEKVQKAKEQEK
ncbi:MAG: 30S ribosomal protein S2 [Candidatus Dojkabacteria bacterium]|nr:MAG: 30S ribosomal protein S2 [Candidatus Dojkabacteria bacterium]